MTETNPLTGWVAVLAEDDATATALIDALQAAGMVARRPAARTEMTPDIGAHAPESVVLALPARANTGSPTSFVLPWDWDVPVLAIGRASEPGLAATLADRGVHHWLADTASCPWAQSLAFAAAVHGRERSQRQRIDALSTQLAEQKLVARAKGLLMAAQDLTEDEAFTLLRSGAMQARLPVGDVARSVVDAAAWAEAVNRAGQLRWLSQRCIAAAAQRLARIDAATARKVQQQSLRRARDILDALGRLPLPEPVRAALGSADAVWLALTACLGLRLDLNRLAAADREAEAALDAAETLTGLLQAVGSSPVLRVVNLCGRQRMRAQRLVKFGLLARLGMASHDTTQAPALMEGFANTLRELDQLPLGSPDISAAHQAVEERWHEMGLALRTGDATALVLRGEALLTSVDILTSRWERSVQLLLG